MSSKQDYYRTPEELLNELGITEPEEIKLEVIAAHCNAYVEYEKLTGCEARILGDGDTAIITVNENSQEYRKRFSIGHELGHWMNDRDKAVFSCSEDTYIREWKKYNPESRANEYSAKLLLPQFMFEPLVKGRDVTFHTVEELATQFRTSLTATAFRLVEVGEFPSMLVLCDSNKRLWFKANKIIPKSLWPREIPGKDSNAARLFRGINIEDSPSEKYADCWFSYNRSERYVIKEHSRRIPPNLVLTLLWWEDEKQILDIMDEEDE